MTDSAPPLETLLNTDHEVLHGETQQVTPMVRRITANNPGKFTFRGTGTYIVGHGKVAIIDPGPADDAHIQALLNAVRGEEVTHILITHTHRDHSPATRAVKEATGATVYGFGPHPSEDPTASEIIPDEDQTPEDNSEKSGDMDFHPDETIRHGDVISSDAKSGSAQHNITETAWTFQCLHTPGHISNHICFALREEQALFTGDHVMGWSSTVIPPPHGNLTEYLASLELLLHRNDQTYWPTHGPPISLDPSSLSHKTSSTRVQPSISPQAFTAALLQHRHSRTNQILTCLAEGPKTIDQLVAEMYADKPKELHKPAAQSVKAHLIHLTETAKVQENLSTPQATPHYSLTSK